MCFSRLTAPIAGHMTPEFSDQRCCNCIASSQLFILASFPKIDFKLIYFGGMFSDDNVGIGPDDNVGIGQDDNVGIGPDDNVGIGIPVKTLLESTCNIYA